jgi:hypothetical protein
MLESFTALDYGLIALIGLIAGTLGGLLGVGGSVIMIPGLTMLVGSTQHQHLIQAAAMIANVAVSVPAAWRHHKAGAMVPKVLAVMLPAALGFVFLGVWLSNLPVFDREHGGTVWLGRLLSLFLLYVIAVNIRRVFKPRRQTADPGEQYLTAPRSITVGGALGTTAGLLGIGGGAIAVPLQQVLLRLPLRSCIANSSAIICFSAAAGAIFKNATLPQHGYAATAGLPIAGLLAPTAILGGLLGAALTHRLPTRQVRVVFILLMIAAAWKMAGF